MDAMLRKQIDELGGAVEDFRSFGRRVEDLERKYGVLPSDLKEQEQRINAAVDAASNAKSALDTLQQEREAESKRISELESAKSELEKQLEELARKSGRPGVPSENPETAEHKAAYSQFLRKGREAGLAELQQKALQTTVDADGGYAVPEQLDLNIIQIERDSNPMRAVSASIQVSTPDYKKLVNLGNAASGWVGETDARPETGTPTLAQLPAYMGEVYANPASTQTALDDAAINIEAWLADEVAIRFADQENEAFTVGNGTNKPRGLLDYPDSAVTDKAGTRPFGTLEELVTAAAGAVSGDDLINLIHSARSGYRANARFMMSNLSVAAMRKLKDSDGNYLWRPGLLEGQPDRLLGYPVVENEVLPEITDGAGSKAVLFGDFSRGYLVVDRMGTRVLRDPFTNKPYVFFYTTKRVGGMLIDSLAIKILASS